MIRFTRLAPGASGTRDMFRGLLHVSACLVMTAAAGLAAAPLAWATAPSNAGGVLLLHVENGVPYEYGTQEHCGDLALSDPSKAVARISGDGTPRLVGVYAAFPPDSVGSVHTFSFGIRYSENVRVVAQAPCNAGGMFIASNAWPASGGGISVFITADGLKRARVIPLYWFAILGKGKGSFEVMPNPVPKLAGRFVSVEMPHQQEAITGYGRLGIDQDGFVPTPGARAVLAPCCVDQCWLLTQEECAVYHGDFLGVGMTCENLPCRPDALLGGCCLPKGCEMLSLVECARIGGTPLGEGVSCDSLPCPKPGGAGAPPK